MRIALVSFVSCVTTFATFTLLSACATAPTTPRRFSCQTTAQWFTNDAKGVPALAVYICFQDDGHLIYQARPLTAEEIKAMTTPVAVTAPNIRIKAPTAKSVPLPTLGGTAK